MRNELIDGLPLSLRLHCPRQFARGIHAASVPLHRERCNGIIRIHHRDVKCDIGESKGASFSHPSNFGSLSRIEPGVRLLLLIQSTRLIEKHPRLKEPRGRGLACRSYTRTDTHKRRIKSREQVKAEELFVTRGARMVKHIRGIAEEGEKREYIRGHNCSFMQGVIVNQSASPCWTTRSMHNPHNRKSENDPGKKKRWEEER